MKSTSESLSHLETSNGRAAGGNYGVDGIRIGRGRLCKLARPKSLMKMRESIKSKSRRNNGKSMEAMTADLNRTLKGWFEYFKHIHASQIGEIDQWLRMRLRSILRKRPEATGRG
jgi:RNA-directed DNA polymerase